MGKAPDFALPSTDGSIVKLTDFSGQLLVLYFYPRDMTPGCTAEACDFRDVHPDFRKYGAAIVGISTDDEKSHRKFSEKHTLPFPLLTDTEHKVSEAYGVWILKKIYGKVFYGIERSTFLIDREGNIVREWRKVKVEDHVIEVTEAVKQLS